MKVKYSSYEAMPWLFLKKKTCMRGAKLFPVDYGNGLQKPTTFPAKLESENEESGMDAGYLADNERLAHLARYSIRAAEQLGRQRLKSKRRKRPSRHREKRVDLEKGWEKSRQTLWKELANLEVLQGEEGCHRCGTHDARIVCRTCSANARFCEACCFEEHKVQFSIDSVFALSQIAI